MHPVVSLHMIRDHEEHSRRRKIWDEVFSPKGKVALPYPDHWNGY